MQHPNILGMESWPEILTLTLEFLEVAFGWVFAILVLVTSILAAFHILLTKNDVRGAIAWIGFVLFVPFFGALIYLLFGINRVRRQAQRARTRRGLRGRRGILNSPEPPDLETLWKEAGERWKAHSHLAGRVAKQPLTGGNLVEPLAGGREAYDAMIEAIGSATRSVALTTYIFQADRAGRRFVQAIKRAHQRGVEVRVLVDSIGNLYGVKPVMNLFRRNDIPVASFNSFHLSRRLAFFNLRTHRKLLVVDGNTGFAGGMNIREGHLEDEEGHQRIADTHFRIKGPLVAQLMEAFADDWLHTTGEDLDGDIWNMVPQPVPASNMIARSIADGPDESMAKTATIIASALGAARRHVQIVTPYFLPDNDLLRALSHASLRGVKVDILIPGTSNLPFIKQASRAYVPALLQSGCNIWLGNPPFDHSKLMTIDDEWFLFGSSNWDARSLRLNFEFNVEMYAPDMPVGLHELMESRFRNAIQVPQTYWQDLPFGKRLVARAFWLMGPYL